MHLRASLSHVRLGNGFLKDNVLFYYMVNMSSKVLSECRREYIITEGGSITFPCTLIGRFPQKMYLDICHAGLLDSLSCSVAVCVLEVSSVLNRVLLLRRRHGHALK